MPANDPVRLSRASWLLLFSLVTSLLFSRSASAQCYPNPLGFQNISVEPGNPFQAEYSTTLTANPRIHAITPVNTLRSVARDSQGRVRIERHMGKFQVQSPDGSRAEEDRTSILICDPVSHSSIQLDTLTKTATVEVPQSSLPRPVFPQDSAQLSFCTRFFQARTRFGDARTEDLGQQQISGVPAQGLRVWLPVRFAGAQTDTSPSYSDFWCSDDVAALVLESFVSNGGAHKNETLLQSITRHEPDAALFQIPANYTRLERTPQPRPVLTGTPTTPQ